MSAADQPTGQPGERSAPQDEAPGGATVERDVNVPTTSGHEASALVIACPYCQSQDVELLALFGAQLLTDQYYCNACHTPFEHVRDA